MKKPMLVAHGIIFLLGLVLSIGLLVIGYNTELMFILAFVISGWINLHLLLGLIQLLEWLGRKRTRAGSPKIWPAPLIVTLILFLLASGKGLGMLNFMLERTQSWTFWNAIGALTTLFPAAVFLGILLRFPWARILAGGGLILSSVAYLAAYVAVIPNEYERLTWQEWILLGGMNGLLVAWGVFFLRSQSVRAFFEPGKAHTSPAGE